MRSQDYPNSRDYYQPIANNAVNPAIDPKRRYLCRHVFTDGHRCGSPSLRGKDLCYYHVRSRRDAPCATRGGTFVMSRIEDRPSVQLAIYDVLSRVSAGDIEYRRGSVLLYGLQIASSNLARHEKNLADQPPQVEEVTSDYDLGDLAPIVEIPDTRTEPATTDQPSTANSVATPDAAADATAHDEVVILTLSGTRGKNPRIPPEEPNDITTTTDDVPQPATDNLQPPTIPAAAVAATTSNLEPRTLPEPGTSVPLPTHDATGRPYPPPHKLNPPSNGKVPRPRTWRTPPTSSPQSRPQPTCN